MGEVENADSPGQISKERLHSFQRQGLFDPGVFLRILHQSGRNPLSPSVMFIQSEEEGAFAADPVHDQPGVRCFDSSEVEEVVALEKLIPRDWGGRAGNDGDPIGDFVHQPLPPSGVLRVLHQSTGKDKRHFFS